MGTYHEPRVPQGSPATGEKDVWFEAGDIRFGHWNGSVWIVDKVINADVDVPAPDYGTDQLAAEDWHYVLPWGEGEYNPEWVSDNAANKLRYRLLTTGGVEFRGQAKSGNYPGQIMTLPQAYRPSAQKDISASSASIRWDRYANAWINCGITIETGGAVEFYNCNFEAGDTVIFQGFVYSL